MNSREEFDAAQSQLADAILPHLPALLNDCPEQNDDVTVSEWLSKKMQSEIADAENVSKEIVESLRIQEQSLSDLQAAAAMKKSRTVWLEETLNRAASAVDGQMSADYFHEIGDTVGKAEQALLRVVRNADGSINQNPNLDGFLAEEYLTQTFNINAAGANNSARASVKSPAPGETYGKNSVDISVHNNGHIVQNYQVKFGKTAEDTIRMLKNGNYNNQRIVVPQDQVEAVKKAFPNKTVVSTVEYQSVVGDSLSKAQAKKLQQLAQTDPDAYAAAMKRISVKKSASFIAKGAIHSAAFGAILNAGMDVIGKKIRHEEIRAKDVLIAAVEGGADMGAKAAITSSIVMASAKGAIKFIPKGTPAGVIAGAVHIAVENAKILYKTAKGEYTPLEGLDKMGEVTTAGVGGLVSAAVGGKIGATVGAAVGTLFGPVGTVIGGVVGGAIGGIVGYAVGSSIGQKIYEGAKKVAKAAVSFISNGIKKLKEILTGQKTTVSGKSTVYAT